MIHDKRSLDAKPFWTNRVICENKLGKHENALKNCENCGSIQNVLRQAFKVNFNTADHGTFMQSIRRRVKHHFESILKLTTQKGNAHLGLGQFDEAKECYESLRTLADNSAVDQYLKKLDKAQKRD